jgi:cardiolipin synthase
VTIRNLRLITLLVVWSTVSCTSMPPMPEGFGGYMALEAWRGETSLSFKYMGPNGLVYTLADWADELEHGATLPESVSIVVLNPSDTGRSPWPGRPESARRIPVLHAVDYWRFRDAVLSAIVPRNDREAVVVELDNEEIALFFDAEGRFHSVLGSPPIERQVVRRYSLEDYLASSPDIMESVLEDLGVSAREVVFNTGDVGEDALPFLYANLDTNLGAYVRVQPLGRNPVEQATLIPITRGVMHLVRSHTTGLMTRPLSSLMRLIFATTDAAVDTIHVASLRLRGSDPIPALEAGPAMNLQEWEADLDELTGRPSEIGRMTYLIDGESFFARLEPLIRETRKSVHMRTYIFDNDDYALHFANLLRSRSSEGVDVKVLIDGIGTLSALLQPASESPQNHQPPISIEGYLERESEVAVRRIYNPFFTGDHTKVIILDEERAFLGGMNIAREYRYEWHDMMVEVEGSVVGRLADDFDLAWAGASWWGDLAEFIARLGPNREPGPAVGYPIRLLYTSPTASEIRRAQLEAIRRSRQYIYIQNAYLTDDTFLLELISARRRGVDVRVVVALESDRGLLTRDNIVAANALFENGIRVYIYPGMSHIKAAIFDGWACLGSANLDQLSLRINKETNVATSEPEAVTALQQQLFDPDFGASPEMRAPFPERWNDALWELVGDYVF